MATSIDTTVRVILTAHESPVVATTTAAITINTTARTVAKPFRCPCPAVATVFAPFLWCSGCPGTVAADSSTHGARTEIRPSRWTFERTHGYP